MFSEIEVDIVCFLHIQFQPGELAPAQYEQDHHRRSSQEQVSQGSGHCVNSG